MVQLLQFGLHHQATCSPVGQTCRWEVCDTTEEGESEAVYEAALLVAEDKIGHGNPAPNMQGGCLKKCLLSMETQTRPQSRQTNAVPGGGGALRCEEGHECAAVAHPDTELQESLLRATAQL